MVYEVVCTKSYLDVGLLIEVNDKLKPKRVLARASTYGNDTEYGGVETLTWVNTGVFLSKDEWANVSYNKGTDQILSELGIEKKIKEERDEDMATVICKTLCGIISGHPRVILFSIISVIVLIIAVIIEWA